MLLFIKVMVVQTSGVSNNLLTIFLLPAYISNVLKLVPGLLITIRYYCYELSSKLIIFFDVKGI